MGHLINPITYRLGKTKFWNFTWSNITKKNYKNFISEDLNFNKFVKWLCSILSWTKIGVFISDFNVIKTYNTLDISIFFFLNKLNLTNFYKKSIFKFSLKNNFLNFFFSFLLNKKFIPLKSGLTKKKQLKKKKGLSLNKIKKNIRKKRMLKVFSKYSLNKKKKKNKKKSFLSSFFLNYCSFLIKKKQNFKNKYLTFLNTFIVSKKFRINSFINFNYKINNNYILEKNFQSRFLNYKFFFNILVVFLTFFLKKIFKHNNFNFNFFQKNSNFLSAKSIKRFIRFNMQKNRSRVTQVVKKVFRKTKKKYYILGLKIGFFGRYEKKLRNKSVWQMRGSLSPSNINTPLTHKNFCILLKQGLCGVRISLLNKLKKNEIFKKKTFVSKSFKIQ